MGVNPDATVHNLHSAPSLLVLHRRHARYRECSADCPRQPRGLLVVAPSPPVRRQNLTR